MVQSSRCYRWGRLPESCGLLGADSLGPGEMREPSPPRPPGAGPEWARNLEASPQGWLCLPAPHPGEQRSCTHTAHRGCKALLQGPKWELVPGILPRWTTKELTGISTDRNLRGSRCLDAPDAEFTQLQSQGLYPSVRNQQRVPVSGGVAGVDTGGASICEGPPSCTLRSRHFSVCVLLQ